MIRIVALAKTRWGALSEGLRLEILICIAAVFLLSWIGPYGTRPDIPLLARGVYWTIAVGAGFLGKRIYVEFIRAHVIRRFGQPFHDIPSIAPTVLAVLISVFFLEAVFREPLPWREAVEVTFNVLALVLGISGSAMLALRHIKTDRPEASSDLQALQAKLPPGLRNASIWAINAEDHYVRVYTEKGDGLIPGRFSDIVNTVSSLDGTRTHRSWWVASQAVARLDRSGGKWTLQISGDLTVPVSRNYRRDVTAKGWADLPTNEHPGASR